ncbi:hypothetical protein Glove_21g282 [Diversispora epigaea]|uniref:Uncharacterized protein n=1 Tax=Diversispora epigaea TaxID=1348612 RepID=A0A397JU91_9GLOM|nr:hypothetical protein Glove_21g282 [Diversispora epigaea]
MGRAPRSSNTLAKKNRKSENNNKIEIDIISELKKINNNLKKYNRLTSKEDYYNRPIRKIVANIFDKNIFLEKFFHILPLFQEFKNNTDKIRLLDISLNFELYINNIQHLFS